MGNNDEIRWRQRLDNLERAWAQLKAACAKTSYSDLELAGLVQMFEFTFELAWKTLKDLLFYEGYEVNSPREAIRQGFASGLIQNPELWLVALESRRSLGDSLVCPPVDTPDCPPIETERLIKDSYAPLLGALVEVLRQRKAGA